MFTRDNNPWLGKHLPDDVKAKISMKLKGNVKWNIGRHHTEEAKRKMSISRTGRKLSEEHKRNIGLAMLGRVFSETTRKKLSIASKGRKPWCTGMKRPEHSALMRGRKMSEEQKLKISIAKRGKKRTPEQCLRSSIAHKGQPAWNKGIPRTPEVKRKLAAYVGPLAANWRGGLSLEPYAIGFTGFLKETIRQRDWFSCQLCGVPESSILSSRAKHLCVHHIDYNKRNHRPDNLIALCPRCHTRTHHKRVYWQELFTNYQSCRMW